jgi:hypothetical protein
MRNTVAFTILICFFILSCKKESFITSGDARVILSSDTLRFDTVFTNTGSVTQLFTIKNGNNQKLKLDNVTLKGGTTSFFKINVDGFTGPSVKNIDVEANDSLYVFVTVSINQNNNNLPFVITDSVEVNYNGTRQYLQLEAWGQNARFIRNGKITGNTIWNNQLPYVIVGALQVDTSASLTIEQGTKIYLHADAPLVVDGSLKVNGQQYDSTKVYFRSDRLDLPYKDYPASWPGIYFRGKSNNNILNYAVIENAYQGVVAEQASINTNPKLTLNQCLIHNIYDAGIYGVQTSIVANNCQVTNCGKNVLLIYGGNYNFTHCTLASVNNNFITHKDAVLVVSNNAKQGNSTVVSALTASFTNCIVWADNGLVEDEVIVSKQGTPNFNVQFSNCLWKVKTNPADITATNIINNIAPVFDSIDASKKIYNFRLKQNSPAINKGIATGLLIDLDGNNRAVGLPDIGAFEKQ